MSIISASCRASWTFFCNNKKDPSSPLRDDRP